MALPSTAGSLLPSSSLLAASAVILLISLSGAHCRPLFAPNIAAQRVDGDRAGGPRTLLQIHPGNFELFLGVGGFPDKYGTGMIVSGDGIERWAATPQLVKGM